MSLYWPDENLDLGIYKTSYETGHACLHNIVMCSMPLCNEKCNGGVFHEYIHQHLSSHLCKLHLLEQQFMMVFQYHAERAIIPLFPAEQRWRDELDDIVIKRLGIRYKIIAFHRDNDYPVDL